MNTKTPNSRPNDANKDKGGQKPGQGQQRQGGDRQNPGSQQTQGHGSDANRQGGAHK